MVRLRTSSVALLRSTLPATMSIWDIALLACA